MVLEYLNIHVQNPELYLYLVAYRKTNSEYITNLNVRAKTIKLLKENLRDFWFTSVQSLSRVQLFVTP